MQGIAGDEVRFSVAPGLTTWMPSAPAAMTALPLMTVPSMVPLPSKSVEIAIPTVPAPLTTFPTTVVRCAVDAVSFSKTFSRMASFRVRLI